MRLLATNLIVGPSAITLAAVRDRRLWYWWVLGCGPDMRLVSPACRWMQDRHLFPLTMHARHVYYGPGVIQMCFPPPDGWGYLYLWSLLSLCVGYLTDDSPRPWFYLFKGGVGTWKSIFNPGGSKTGLPKVGGCDTIGATAAIAGVESMRSILSASEPS